MLGIAWCLFAKVSALGHICRRFSDDEHESNECPTGAYSSVVLVMKDDFPVPVGLMRRMASCIASCVLERAGVSSDMARLCWLTLESARDILRSIAERYSKPVCLFQLFVFRCRLLMRMSKYVWPSNAPSIEAKCDSERPQCRRNARQCTLETTGTSWNQSCWGKVGVAFLPMFGPTPTRPVLRSKYVGWGTSEVRES